MFESFAMADAESRPASTMPAAKKTTLMPDTGVRGVFALLCSMASTIAWAVCDCRQYYDGCSARCKRMGFSDAGHSFERLADEWVQVDRKSTSLYSSHA